MLQNQMFLPTFKNCGGHIVDALRSLMLGLHFFLNAKVTLEAVFLERAENQNR